MNRTLPFSLSLYRALKIEQGTSDICTSTCTNFNKNISKDGTWPRVRWVTCFLPIPGLLSDKQEWRWACQRRIWSQTPFHLHSQDRSPLLSMSWVPRLSGCVKNQAWFQTPYMLYVFSYMSCNTSHRTEANLSSVASCLGVSFVHHFCFLDLLLNKVRATWTRYGNTMVSLINQSGY